LAVPWLILLLVDRLHLPQLPPRQQYRSRIAILRREALGYFRHGWIEYFRPPRTVDARLNPPTQ
jgi:hypothetical protein